MGLAEHGHGWFGGTAAHPLAGNATPQEVRPSVSLGACAVGMPGDDGADILRQSGHRSRSADSCCRVADGIP